MVSRYKVSTLKGKLLQGKYFKVYADEKYVQYKAKMLLISQKLNNYLKVAQSMYLQLCKMRHMLLFWYC